MRELVPRIHVLLRAGQKTWMAGTSPGHDEGGLSARETATMAGMPEMQKAGLTYS